VKSGIVFDLDGTLYDATGVDSENRYSALGAISEFLSISKNEASILLDRTQQTSGITSISRAIFALEVPDSIFLKHQLINIHPEQHIKPDPELVSLIRKAIPTYKMALYTNTRREFVSKITQCIGFWGDEFGVIVAGGDAQEPKPSISELQKVVQQLGISPVDCYAVGDRWAVDLAPASSIGMTPVHVTSRDELFDWLCSII
jgi:FMN phosphatase YigB (HAD superfamily)